MRNELHKLADLKVGMKRTNQDNWESGAMHSINPRMENGLDTRRLLALANVIQDLPLAPLRGTGGHDWADGPVVAARFIHGDTPVKGYILRDATERGFGLVEFESHKSSGINGYWLTGYGLCCWAWGEQMGMAAVAGNGMVAQLQAVLTAEPVWQRTFREYTISKVKPEHIAEALRRFVDCRDAVDAWRQVAAVYGGVLPVVSTPPKSPLEVKAAPEPVTVETRMTGTEVWKTRFTMGDYAGAAETARRKVEELETQMVDWRKKLAAAEAML